MQTLSFLLRVVSAPDQRWATEWRRHLEFVLLEPEGRWFIASLNTCVMVGENVESFVKKAGRMVGVNSAA